MEILPMTCFSSARVPPLSWDFYISSIFRFTGCLILSSRVSAWTYLWSSISAGFSVSAFELAMLVGTIMLSRFGSLSGGKLRGAKGEIIYSSPSVFLTSLFQPCASSHIFCSLAYCVEVKRYYLWSGLSFKCFIFYLQLSICQHSMQRTSLLLFFLIVFSLLMKTSHSVELRLIIT